MLLDIVVFFLKNAYESVRFIKYACAQPATKHWVAKMI